MKIKISKKLVTECFALLGVAEFKEQEHSKKRVHVREKLIKIINENT